MRLRSAERLGAGLEQVALARPSPPAPWDRCRSPRSATPESSRSAAADCSASRRAWVAGKRMEARLQRVVAGRAPGCPRARSAARPRAPRLPSLTRISRMIPPSRCCTVSPAAIGTDHAGRDRRAGQRRRAAQTAEAAEEQADHRARRRRIGRRSSCMRGSAACRLGATAAAARRGCAPAPARAARSDATAVTAGRAAPLDMEPRQHLVARAEQHAGALRSTSSLSTWASMLGRWATRITRASRAP